MPSTQYIAQTRINHDRRVYWPGQVMPPLSDRQRDHLLREGHIKLATEGQSKAAEAEVKKQDAAQLTAPAGAVNVELAKPASKPAKKAKATKKAKSSTKAKQGLGVVSVAAPEVAPSSKASTKAKRGRPKKKASKKA